MKLHIYQTIYFCIEPVTQKYHIICYIIKCKCHQLGGETLLCIPLADPLVLMVMWESVPTGKL